MCRKRWHWSVFDMLLNGTADDLHVLTLGLSPVSNVFFSHKIKETERRQQREICTVYVPIERGWDWTSSNGTLIFSKCGIWAFQMSSPGKDLILLEWGYCHVPVKPDFDISLVSRILWKSSRAREKHIAQNGRENFALQLVSLQIHTLISTCTRFPITFMCQGFSMNLHVHV